MTNREAGCLQKKPYSPPRIVAFGAIEAMTGDCWGFCVDGVNGGMWGGPAPYR